MAGEGFERMAHDNDWAFATAEEFRARHVAQAVATALMTTLRG
jgi:hypothetical protein